VTVILKTISAYGHGCYVCTPSNDSKRDAELNELSKIFPGIYIRKCNEFHRSIRDEFLLECPKDYHGCLTKFEANSITRQCSKIAVNDCQEANGVTYCYCKNDACNNPDRKLDDPAPGQLLTSSSDKKSSKSRGSDPSTGKLISIGTGFSDDEDIRIVNKNQRIVHHHSRPGDDDEEEEGSGGDYYGELYYSESDENYPIDYSDTTDRTDTEDLIIEEAPYDRNIINQVIEDSKLDEINFDDEYEGRKTGIKTSDGSNTKTNVYNNAKSPKTNSAEFSNSRSNTCILTSVLTVLFLSLL